MISSLAFHSKPEPTIALHLRDHRHLSHQSHPQTNRFRIHPFQHLMAFKEVRRRSDLFRPWDSSISPLSPSRPTSGQSESSSPSLASIPPKRGSKAKQKESKTEVTKASQHISRPPIRASLCDSTSNSISCPPLPSLPPHWPQTLYPNVNHYGVNPKNNSMLCPPHSTLPMTDSFYDQFSQTFAAPTPFEQSLVNPPNLSSQWRQLQNQKKQRPKRFQCPHCRVSFSNNGQLKGHIRIHTGIDRNWLLFQSNVD